MLDCSAHRRTRNSNLDQTFLSHILHNWCHNNEKKKVVVNQL